MRYRGMMPLLVLAMLSTAAAAPELPETIAARRLDREAQFELRLGRADVAHEKMQIAEWLAPNVNRQSMLLRITQTTKGRSYGHN